MRGDNTLKLIQVLAYRNIANSENLTNVIVKIYLDIKI